MDYRKFTKKELVGILDIIHSSILCTNEMEMRGIMEKLKGLVGGDYGICGIGMGDTNGLAGPPQIINESYPLEWLKIYGGKELYYADPLVLHNFSNPGAQIWEETYSIYNERLSPLFLTSRDFGLLHGVSGGMYNESSRTASMFSFAGKGKWFGSHQKEILDKVGPHIHQALGRLLKQFRKSGAELSVREREVSNWMKAGKTNWEISVILGISERTVKFHIQNIERKLNAVNKAHAVAILMEQESAD